MSEIKIKDGTGTGRTVAVNTSNRLLTSASSVSEAAKRTQDGYAYNLNTGIINLTSASASAVAYLKYTGSTKLEITALAVGTGNWAGTPTDPGLITMVRNPTGGTIIDNAVAGDMNQNRNFGSSNTLSGAWYKGVEGDTLTGGNDIAIFYQNDNGRLFAGIDFVLETTNSIGIKIQPNDATAGNLYVALICYEAE